MYNKKYTPKYDYDVINKKYLYDILEKIFGVGYIYIGSNPSDILKGNWEKIQNVSIGNKTVDAWIRTK